MRSYPVNSPQAAARIVALTLLADGHLCKAELDMLAQQRAAEQLGLSSSELQDIVRVFCEDLLAGARTDWSDACSIDPRTLAELMAEIDDPELRLKLIKLCVAIVEADDHLAEGEATVLTAAVEHWQMQRMMLQLNNRVGA
jgi:uncharacterized tellurite resistance protein B-like protein